MRCRVRVSTHPRQYRFVFCIPNPQRQNERPPGDRGFRHGGRITAIALTRFVLAHAERLTTSVVLLSIRWVLRQD